MTRAFYRSFIYRCCVSGAIGSSIGSMTEFRSRILHTSFSSLSKFDIACWAHTSMMSTVEKSYMEGAIFSSCESQVV